MNIFACLALLFILSIGAAASDKELRISLPKKSKPTPVQKLNQEGVKLLQKHEYKKAKTVFYKAYLIDPNDPFTLNNLGYVAELEGQIDRAQRYYALAADHTSDALVVKSTEKEAIGKPVDKVAGNAADAQMQINRINVYAMGLLQKDRAPEADVALQKALKLDPGNPFTLNNLGYAREKEGELEDAYKFYTEAAQKHSETPVVVTLRPSWRGKPISDIASRNAAAVKKVIERDRDNLPAQVARLNTRGVAAINRNDYKLARSYFERAYKLDPKNAFALNNMGYLAEMDGDRETADFYYGKAKDADQSSMRVAYASRKDAEGEKLGAVAASSDESVNKAMEEALEARRREGGPVILHTRDNEPVVEPKVPPKLQPSEPIHSVEVPEPGSGGLLQPLPENEQPKVPEEGQPAGQPAAQPPQTQPQGQIDNGIIMPLPDNQQPGAAQPQTPPSTPPQAAQPNPQPQGQIENGVMMPLPDNQQPPAAKEPPH